MPRKHYANGRSRGGPPFVRVLHRMYDSQAWRALKPLERALYLEVVRRYNGYNNGDIFLSCREAAAALFVAKGTAGRAFQILVAHGLIAITKPAAFNMKQREATRYRLTCEGSLDTGGKPMAPTNEWLDWRPVDKPSCFGR